MLKDKLIPAMKTAGAKETADDAELLTEVGSSILPEKTYAEILNGNSEENSMMLQ